MYKTFRQSKRFRPSIEKISVKLTPKNDVLVTAKGTVSDSEKHEVEKRYPLLRRSRWSGLELTRLDRLG